eukprot:181071-Rhodomonas_salina.1
MLTQALSGSMLCCAAYTNVAYEWDPLAFSWRDLSTVFGAPPAERYAMGMAYAASQVIVLGGWSAAVPDIDR